MLDVAIVYAMKNGLRKQWKRYLPTWNFISALAVVKTL